MAKKKKQSKRALRNLRIQQFIFIIIGIMIIFAMVLSLVAN